MEINDGLKFLEEKVMELMLSGEHPTLRTLYQQWKNSTIINVKFTGSGFFIDYKISESAPVLTGKQSLAFGDVWTRITGPKYPVGHVLFAENGRLTQLEGYLVADEQWPEKIEVLKVNFVNDEERDWENLTKELS